jgi:hypothetical protein
MRSSMCEEWRRDERRNDIANCSQLALLDMNKVAVRRSFFFEASNFENVRFGNPDKRDRSDDVRSSG